MYPVTPWFANKASLFDLVYGDDVKCNVTVEKSRRNRDDDDAINIEIHQFDFNFHFVFPAFVDTTPEAPGGPDVGYRLCVDELHKPAVLFQYYVHNRLSLEPTFTMRDVENLYFVTVDNVRRFCSTS